MSRSTSGRPPTVVDMRATSDLQAQRRSFGIGVILLCIPLVVALCSFAFPHLLRTAFWYDESMQFWMSLGADDFGPPFSAPGTLRDVIRQNAASNLDPGGFSILLHFWLQIGKGEIWQRLLPFLFFAISVGGMGWIGWTLRPSPLFALLCASVPALYPLLLDYATEVRAYSMEFAGVIVGCALIDRLLRRPGISTFLACGTIFGLFLTSRYSFGLFAAAASLTLIWSSQNSSGRTVRPLDVLAFAGPIACSSAVIFVLALRPQYRGRITYNGGELVQYLADATAAGKSASKIVAMAGTNLFSPPGIPLTLAATIGLFILIPVGWRERVGFGRVSAFDDSLAAFGVLVLAAIALTALIWPWHPWDMTTKWSLWLHALSAVALVRFAAALLALASPLSNQPPEKDWRVAALLVAGIVALDLRMALYRRPDAPTLVPVLAYLDRVAPPPGSIAVDPHWYPTLRYFYEYGYLAGRASYPASFRLSDRDGPQPLVGPDTKYLMTVMAIEDARKMFAPAIIVRDPEIPDQLYRVEHAGRQSP
jgi:hypothetical protein